MKEVLFTKEEARLLENAKRVYNDALKNCDPLAAIAAAETFERVGATTLAERARRFAAALRPEKWREE